MTETLKQEIVSCISDEEHDTEKYKRMAEEAETCGCDRMAGVLRDIAKEEGSHKKLLSEMISGKF